jgi:hypothetical protein
MGHTAEDHERLEARRKKNRDYEESDDSRYQSNRRSDKSRKGKTSGRDRKDRGSSGTKSTSRREEAVKGVSQEVLSQRRGDEDCLRCGRSGHGLFECWAKEPNTKEKRKEPSSESGSSASKRPKTSAAAAAQAA